MSMTLRQQIACLKREIALRKNVYPKWVESGKMRSSEADYEIEAMTAALHTLMQAETFGGVPTTPVFREEK
jgi:hypothetical protein